MIKDGQHQNKTDEELVILTLQNQEYFLYLMKRYEKRLLGYIMRISNVTKEEAEDILQEVFIKTYLNINDFDKRLKFSSWIYRIAHNQVISSYRKKKARPQILVLDKDNSFLENLVSDLNLDREIDLKDLKKDVNKILGKIDIKYREVLILKFLEDKSYQEISDILKKPMGTVATLLNRSKKQFKKELKKQNINF